MQISQELADKYEHGHNKLIHEVTGLCKTTICNAFKYKQCSEKTYKILVDFYTVKTLKSEN
jgi:hypothetical protein